MEELVQKLEEASSAYLELAEKARERNDEDLADEITNQAAECDDLISNIKNADNLIGSVDFYKKMFN